MTFKREIIQPINTGTLVCTSCKGEPQPYDSFYRAKPGSMNHRTYGGFAMPCRECNKKRCAKRGYTDSDKVRAKRHRSTDEYRSAENDRQMARYYKSHESNKQKMRERYANLSPEKRDEFLAKCRANSANPEAKARAAAQLKERRKTPEFKAAHTAWNRKRRIAKRGVDAKLSAKEWIECLAAYGRECIYCETVCANPTMDHVVPLVNGGTHSKENVVPACLRCNCSKQDSDVDTFLLRNSFNRRRYLLKRTLGLFRLQDTANWSLIEPDNGKLHSSQRHLQRHLTGNGVSVSG